MATVAVATPHRLIRPTPELSVSKAFAVLFIFVHHNMVENLKKKQKNSNKKEAHKDMYMDYRIRRKKQWLI